jgi:hypothetical protein
MKYAGLVELPPSPSTTVVRIFTAFLQQATLPVDGVDFILIPTPKHMHQVMSMALFKRKT